MAATVTLDGTNVTLAQETGTPPTSWGQVRIRGSGGMPTISVSTDVFLQGGQQIYERRMIVKLFSALLGLTILFLVSFQAHAQNVISRTHIHKDDKAHTVVTASTDGNTMTLDIFVKLTQYCERAGVTLFFGSSPEFYDQIDFSSDTRFDRNSKTLNYQVTLPIQYYGAGLEVGMIKYYVEFWFSFGSNYDDMFSIWPGILFFNIN
jgi:hypothetical protein